MWVKICANTNAPDALEAARLGADALGFVFAPSKRQVTAEQVRVISELLPPHIERVGVFAGHSVKQIAAIAKDANLTTVQLHDGYVPAFSMQLQALLGDSVAIIQTTAWEVGRANAAQLVAREIGAIAFATPWPRILVDAKVAGHSGGLGRTFDWDEAAQTLAHQTAFRVLLAGGLTPENVNRAVQTLRPWGVDVASGVEQSPGKKDWLQLAAFIKNAREASAQRASSQIL